MASITKFEDLIAWQKARVLTSKIYAVTKTGAFSKDFGLMDQIRRSSVSIMSNIAEGFDRANIKEFHRFLLYAKGSCGELWAQLYAALDVSYIEQHSFQELYNDSNEVGKIIGGLVKNLKSRIPKK